MNGLLYQLFSVPSIERVYHWMALVPLLTTKINFRLMLCLKMIQFASWLWLFFGANIETCDERRNNLLYLEAFVIYLIIISDLKLGAASFFRVFFSCVPLLIKILETAGHQPWEHSPCKLFLEVMMVFKMESHMYALCQQYQVLSTYLQISFVNDFVLYKLYFIWKV